MDAMSLIDLDPDDAADLTELYRAAAAGGTLGRDPDEYEEAEVRASIGRALDGGIALGARRGQRIVGAVTAVRLKPRRFAHVLSSLTIAVDPAHHREGIGRTLLGELLDRADRLQPPVRRVELMLQAGNPAVRLYADLGFRQEGVLRARVAGVTGPLDDILMARIRQA